MSSEDLHLSTLRGKDAGLVVSKVSTRPEGRGFKSNFRQPFSENMPF